MKTVHPRLGALPDTKDSRDYLFRKIVQPPEIVPITDYEDKMSPIRDQAQRGACVAFATCAVKEYQERKQRKSHPKIDLSEEWIYEQVRQQGGGAQPRDAMDLLIKQGVCSERVMPYDPRITEETEPTFTRPTGGARSASRYRAQAYARLLSLNDICQSIAINGPCVIGIDWHDSWFDDSGQTLDGYPIIDITPSPVVGGHALAIVGYNTNHKIFKIRNSWGKTWGRNGYAYLTFRAVNLNLNDAWTTTDLDELKRMGVAA